MTDKLDKHLEEIDPSRREMLRKLVMGSAFAAPVAVSYLLGSTQSASALVIATGSGKAKCVDATPPIPQSVIDKTPIYSANTSSF